MHNLFRRRIATLGVTAALLVGGGLSSCIKDLDRKPVNEPDTEAVYRDPSNYIHVLAKLYAGLSTTGQAGPAGTPDLFYIDEGFGQYVRQLWCLQELPTEEAVISWRDKTIQDLHNMTWSANDAFVQAMYYRIYFQVDLANEFIRETTDEKLASRNITGQDAENARLYRAEARFLRALSYYHALDLFGNVPFVTEADVPGKKAPRRITRPELFSYVESELKAIEGQLKDPRTNDYGRVDKAAAWTLLAKLYLNAQVYVGQDRNTDCITYCDSVITHGNGYALMTDQSNTTYSAYEQLFLADNDRTSRQEFILPVTVDGQRTKSYGTTNFLVHASCGSAKQRLRDYGVDQGWSGYRTTKEFVALMPDTVGTPRVDTRALFFKRGQTLEINVIEDAFGQGYLYKKFRNVRADGGLVSDAAKTFVDIDFPMFRYADVLLMYAEAVVRGGSGGDRSLALQYVNDIRTRAFKGPDGNISDAELTLDFLLAERGRELFLECQRRTDLIRFGKFTTGDYLWAWKGGVKDGRAVGDFRTLYPIPASDIAVNSNLTQNPGY